MESNIVIIKRPKYEKNYKLDCASEFKCVAKWSTGNDLPLRS